MTGKLDKARAVFLATLMVVSVFGGTLAFAGTAAAATDSVTLHKSVNGDQLNYVTDGQTVYVKLSDGTTSGADAQVTVSSPNGESQITVYDTGANADDTADDGVYWGSFTIGTSSTITAAHGEDVTVTGPNLDSGSGTEGSATVTADYQGPQYQNKAPTGTISDNQPVISVDISDANSGVVASWTEVKVTNSAGETVFHKLNATESPSVTYQSGTLQISVPESKIDQLADDTYNVEVTAYDNIGHETTTGTWTFTVDTNPVSATIDQAPSGTESTSEPTTNVQASVNTDVGSLSSATLTVENGLGYYETLDMSSSAWTGSGFDASFGSSGDLPALPDGDYTVTVSAENDEGDTASAQTQFSVDTSAPSVNSVTVSDNNADDANDVVNADESSSVKVTIDFNESVSAYAGTISIDGTEKAFSASNVGGQSTVEHIVDVSNTQSGINTAADNDSAVVNVTSVTDSHTNQVTNVDSVVSEQTFSIDTEEPTVTKTDGDFPNKLSGVVDFRNALTYSDNEGTLPFYLVQVGQSGDYVPLHEFDSLDDFDTSTLFEGTHNFKIIVSDDAGNTKTVDYTLAVDNADPSYDYVGTGPITGTVDLLGDNFELTNNGTETATVYYKYYADQATATSNADGLSDLSTYTQSRTLDVNAGSDGYYVVAAEVANPDAGTQIYTTVVEAQTLESSDFQISASENANDAGQVNVTVTSAVDLSSFNVSVNDNDDYYSPVSSALTGFEQSETPTNSGNYEYTYVYDAPRDGQYTFELENASLDEQHIELSTKTADATVDNSMPTVIDADVVSADEDQTDVQVRFSEPVSGPTSIDDFHGVSVSDSGAAYNTGEVTLTIADEVQTGGNETLTFNGLSEVSANDVNDDGVTSSTSVDVTYSLELSEGLNVVSIPAETGGVSLDSLNLGELGVDSVMEYDAFYGNDSTSYVDEWAAYDAQTGEGELQYMEGGDGYVIVANESAELDLEVENVPQDGATRMSQENLEAGWNLVGAFQEGSQNVDQAFSGLTDHVWTVQEGYSGDQPSNLEGGQGYWLSVNKDALHVPVDYVGATSERPSVYEVTIAEETPSNDANDKIDAGETVKVSAKVDDDSSIQTVMVDASPLGGANDLELTGSDGVYTATFTASIVDDTSETLQVTAVDTESNIGYGSGSTTVSKDVSINTASIDSPTSDSPTTVGTTKSLTVDYNAQDTNFDTATVKLLADDGTELASKQVQSGGSGLSATFDLSSSGEDIGAGTYDIALVVTDTGSNSKTVTETDAVTVDSSVTVNSVTATIQNGNDIAVTVEASEQLSALSVDGVGTTLSGIGTTFTENANGDGSYTYTATATGVSDGTYTASVVSASDNYGNSGSDLASSSQMTVEVAPSLDSSSPKDGATGVSTSTSSITLTFSESVNVADGSLITLDQSETVSVDSTSTSGNKVVLTVDQGSLSSGTTYTLTVGASAVEDTDDTATANDEITVTFTTA